MAEWPQELPAAPGSGGKWRILPVRETRFSADGCRRIPGGLIRRSP